MMGLVFTLNEKVSLFSLLNRFKQKKVNKLNINFVDEALLQH